MPMAVNGFDVAPSHATTSIWRPLTSLPLTPFTCQNLHTLNPRPRCRTFKHFCRPSSSAVAHTSPPLSGDLDRYLRCSMPQNSPLRVAVLVNGGVDSSVALRLLHAASHSCTAFYLKIWFQSSMRSNKALRIAEFISNYGMRIMCLDACMKEEVFIYPWIRILSSLLWSCYEERKA
ncbi:hypothetical protein JHK86_051566 [Glycine max]|nr:hypothetical protein JHK86_051566 [Glycine max]